MANIVGLDGSLAYLIQFGQLDLNSPPITLRHTIPQTFIPTSWELLQPNDFNQHSSSLVATSPSSSRNQFFTQNVQPMVNLVIVHSLAQHVASTIVTNLPTYS